MSITDNKGLVFAFFQSSVFEVPHRKLQLISLLRQAFFYFYVFR